MVEKSALSGCLIGSYDQALQNIHVLLFFYIFGSLILNESPEQVKYLVTQGRKKKHKVVPEMKYCYKFLAGNSDDSFCPPSEKRSTQKVVETFSRGLMCRKANRLSQKLSPLKKWTINLYI